MLTNVLMRGDDAELPAAEVLSGAGSGGRLSIRSLVATGAGESDALIFRIGRELYAVDLALVEEAIDQLVVNRLPGMSNRLIGVAAHREGLLPVYSPRILGSVPEGSASVVLVVRVGGRRIGLEVDDAEDVMTIAAESIQKTPSSSEDAVLFGVFRRGPDLVSLVDVNELAARCLAREASEAV